MEHAPCDIVLDVGNSRTKVGVHTAGRWVKLATLPNTDREGLMALLNGKAVSAVVIGSVAERDPELVEQAGTVAPVLEVTGATPSPLQQAYGTPFTLGADRLANAVAAWQAFPGRPVLVIDPGTCITYDLVEADGSYLGGAISPGLRMRAFAMHHHSARLPLVEPPSSPGLLGRDTASSLASGMHHGILGEMHHYVGAMRMDRPQLAVVLTGGDAPRFAAALKSGIFAHPLLTLNGLHALLEHHRAISARVPHGPRPGPRPGTTG